MTTVVATNFQETELGIFKTSALPPNCMEGLSAEQVEDILNLACDGTLWNSMEDFKCSEADGADFKCSKADGADFKYAEADGAGKKTKAIKGSTWIIVNPKDPHIINIGKFAVKERNIQAGTKLAFVRVVSGLQLHIAAFNKYALILEVKDGQTTCYPKVLVFEGPFGYKKLLFWKN